MCTTGALHLEALAGNRDIGLRAGCVPQRGPCGQQPTADGEKRTYTFDTLITLTPKPGAELLLWSGSKRHLGEAALEQREDDAGAEGS